LNRSSLLHIVGNEGGYAIERVYICVYVFVRTIILKSCGRIIMKFCNSVDFGPLRSLIVSIAVRGNNPMVGDTFLPRVINARAL